jgi:hypothetical protein
MKSYDYREKMAEKEEREQWFKPRERFRISDSWPEWSQR